MEDMGMSDSFSGIYKDKVVLITGHTGFKGSWLTLWLKKLGAKVIGYSLKPPTKPSHFELLKLDIVSIIGDIRDKDKLYETFSKYKPAIVFHLAAQPLVRYSYLNPVETFEINVMGTINIFEACRRTESVRGIVNVTSDKCYKNKDRLWEYKEDDPMGGNDPYSSSKGCAELITASYRNSFFNLEKYKKTHNILLASARAGNVIGGGDWADDRLIPDIVRAVSKGEKVIIRNPKSARPWQYVLESLSGYLILGQKLLEGKDEFAEAWNFGPPDDLIYVEDVVKNIKALWKQMDYEIAKNKEDFYEARFLGLDCSKAHLKLKWRSVWDFKKALSVTIRWHKEFYGNPKNKKVFLYLSLRDLDEYLEDAKAKRVEWAL